MSRSLTRAISAWAQSDGSEIAIVADGVSFTRQEWAARTARLAGLLRGRGLAADGRVAILGQNSHRHIQALYASMWAGGIAVPLNWRLALGELVATVRDCEPAVLIADAQFAQQAAALAAAVP